MRRWYATDDVRLSVVFHDWDTDEPADCDTAPTITVYNAVGTAIITDTAMSESGNTGEYYYDLEIPASSQTGVFLYVCSGDVNSKTQNLKSAIEVI